MRTAKVNRIHYWRAIGMSGVARDDQGLPIFGIPNGTDPRDGEIANHGRRASDRKANTPDAPGKNLTPA